jgi:Ca2+-binding EF-hand superfamily protein
MEHLADAFDRLDGDEKGYISADDLKNLLGTDYNEEKVSRRQQYSIQYFVDVSCSS